MEGQGRCVNPHRVNRVFARLAKAKVSLFDWYQGKQTAAPFIYVCQKVLYVRSRFRIATCFLRHSPATPLGLVLGFYIGVWDVGNLFVCCISCACFCSSGAPCLRFAFRRLMPPATPCSVRFVLVQYLPSVPLVASLQLAGGLNACFCFACGFVCLSVRCSIFRLLITFGFLPASVER